VALVQAPPPARLPPVLHHHQQCAGSAGGGWHGWGAAVSGGCTIESGSGAIGWSHVSGLRCGPTVALGLCGMGHWHLPGVGLAGVVTVAGGGCWCGLSVAGSGGGSWAMCCVPG
jgi:hypothetical protein